MGESCGSLQYSPSGVSTSERSAGDRQDDGGRKPTVHAGGSLMPTVKSPLAIPTGLFIGPIDWMDAM
jgi:hypothetical protein